MDKEGNLLNDTQLIQAEHFSKISLEDPFFSSLKADYAGFEKWFHSKGSKPDSFAYTFRNAETGGLDGFLYLKDEHGEVEDVHPPLHPARRLKIGTFKVNPHGTRLGERFMKRAFDLAISKKVDSLYVTVFAKHAALVDLFVRYGFSLVAKKPGANGEELVLERNLRMVIGDVVLDYPRIPIREGRHFVLSLYPMWHSRLLPDSLLNTESPNILEDVSHTNSIHKIYLTAMQGIDQLRRGDTLLIYRTASGGAAYYTSVITSLCVVEEVVHISRFKTEAEFLEYCAPYSVFSKAELIDFFKRKTYPWIIRFTYNLALKKRLNRKVLLEEIRLPSNIYWGFFAITTENLLNILKHAGDYEKASTLIYPS